MRVCDYVSCWPKQHYISVLLSHQQNQNSSTGRLKMQDMENDGPHHRAGKCRTLKIMDQNPRHKKLHAGSCLHRPYLYLLLPINCRTSLHTDIRQQAVELSVVINAIRRHTSCSRSVIFQVLQFPAIENFWSIIFWSCKFCAPFADNFLNVILLTGNRQRRKHHLFVVDNHAYAR